MKIYLVMEDDGWGYAVVCVFDSYKKAEKYIWSLDAKEHYLQNFYIWEYEINNINKSHIKTTTVRETVRETGVK